MRQAIRQFASDGLNRGRSRAEASPIFDHIEFERRRYRQRETPSSPIPATMMSMQRRMAALVEDAASHGEDRFLDGVRRNDEAARSPPKPAIPACPSEVRQTAARPSVIEDGAILRGRTTVQTGSGDGVEHPQTSCGLRPRWARSHCVISVATFEPLCRSG